MKRKGLSALKFITDYGWVFVTVIIVVCLFWYMGLFNGGQCMGLWGYEYIEDDGTVVFCHAVEKPMFKEGHTLKNCDNGKIYNGVMTYRRTQKCR